MIVPMQGKYGWLFLDNDTNKVIWQVSGRMRLDPHFLNQQRHIHELRAAWAARKGIGYYPMIVPEKHVVYPELMADGTALSDKRVVNQLRQHLAEHSFLDLLYPIDEIMAAKQEALVFYWDDTHWNYRGAFAAVQALTRHIARDAPIRVLAPEEVIFGEGDADGVRPYCGYRPHDLKNKLVPDYMGRLSYQTIPGAQAVLTHDNGVLYTGKKLVFENARTDLPRAVMFRDSCADFMLAQLAESFSRLTAFWQNNVDFTEIEQERPDVVIVEQVERFLVELPHDVLGKSAKQRENVKLAKSADVA